MSWATRILLVLVTVALITLATVHLSGRSLSSFLFNDSTAKSEIVKTIDVSSNLEYKLKDIQTENKKTII